jgi:hypothetical protein
MTKTAHFGSHSKGGKGLITEAAQEFREASGAAKTPAGKRLGGKVVAQKYSPLSSKNESMHDLDRNHVKGPQRRGLSSSSWDADRLKCMQQTAEKRRSGQRETEVFPPTRWEQILSKKSTKQTDTDLKLQELVQRVEATRKMSSSNAQAR